MLRGKGSTVEPFCVLFGKGTVVLCKGTIRNPVLLCSKGTAEPSCVLCSKGTMWNPVV